MPWVTPKNFSIALLGGNKVRIDVDFQVECTETERRLKIPSRVYLKLMERDGARDRTHLHGEDWQGRWVDPKGNKDEEATGWLYVGTYTDSAYNEQFSRELDKDNLPHETGNEEWYCVMIARPDIWSDVYYSEEISANLG